tara:strand:+ start:921 stop:1610 length:690 start_codon:yes stop_codon:yes gene_type:complete
MQHTEKINNSHKQDYDLELLKIHIKLIKSIAQNGHLSHFLQDPESLANVNTENKNRLIYIKKAIHYLSIKEPKFISTYILEPFVHQFGDFCKRHPLQKRWPSFVELGLAFRHMTSSYISESFIKKRTKYYTLRRIVRNNPGWDEACNRGQKGPVQEGRKLHFRENISDLIEEYWVYLKETKKERERTEQSPHFRLFAEFFLALCDANEIPVNRSLTVEVIKKFEKLNEA